MDKMMVGMDVKPSNRVDEDFVAMNGAPPSRRHRHGAIGTALSDWADRNPDIARKFIDVIYQSAHWANAHQTETAERGPPHTPSVRPGQGDGPQPLPDFARSRARAAAPRRRVRLRFPRATGRGVDALLERRDGLNRPRRPSHHIWVRGPSRPSPWSARSSTEVA
jgi:ABC-type nitrate/sulfonate/bicarbonate transport system substrate-binding protein